VGVNLKIIKLMSMGATKYLVNISIIGFKDSRAIFIPKKADPKIKHLNEAAKYTLI
jgi:hypothetical protein